jgi:hypothetical protein
MVVIGYSLNAVSPTQLVRLCSNKAAFNMESIGWMMLMIWQSSPFENFPTTLPDSLNHTLKVNLSHPRCLPAAKKNLQDAGKSC